MGRQAVAAPLGARGQASDRRQPHHLHDGLRVLAGRRHGDRAELRHLDRTVRHEHGHRIPDRPVEHRSARRGDEAIHVQRQSQRLVRTPRPEQVPRRPRGMAQVREPRRQGRGESAERQAEAPANDRADGRPERFGHAHHPRRLRQRSGPQAGVGWQLRGGHADRQQSPRRRFRRNGRHRFA